MTSLALGWDVQEAERAALGSMILNVNACHRLLTELSADDFCYPSHRETFEAIQKLAADNESVDEITVTRAVQTIVARPGYHVRTLCEGTPAATNCLSYARMVKAESARRAAAAAVDQMQRAVDDRQLSGEQVLEQVQSLAFKLASPAKRSNRTGSGELMDELMAELESPDAERIPFPFQALNEEQQGFEMGELITLAGYSGDGKSWAALQFLESACLGGYRVGYFSLEMPARQLARRIVSQGGIPLSKLRQNSFEDAAAFDLRREVVKGMRFDVYGGTTTPDRIRAEQAQQRYDLLIVDHLHRMPRADRFELEDLVVSLKNIALDLDCAVLMLCQLSRREGFPVPSVAQLRDTAVIENESDCVLFVYRQRNSDGLRLESGEGFVVVGKMRDGEGDYKFPVRFDAGRTRWVEA